MLREPDRDTRTFPGADRSVLATVAMLRRGIVDVDMLDHHLRATKDRVVGPITRVLAPWLPPAVLTAASLVVGLTSAVAAAFGLTWWAVGCWWFSRLADGLDGAVARTRGRSSDLGGYLDLLGDTVVYAAIPLGVAVGAADQRVWIATAALLATFYVNAVSWLFIAALIEKRAAERDTQPGGTRSTTIAMPTGLVEGTETIVLYSLLLILPDHAVAWFTVMAILVTATVLQRLVWALRHLR